MKTLLLTISLLVFTLLLSGCFGNKQHETHLVAYLIEKMSSEYGLQDVVYYDVHFKELKNDKEATKELLKLLEKKRAEGKIRATLKPFPSSQDEAASQAFIEDTTHGETTAVLRLYIVQWKTPHEAVVQVSIMDTPGQAKGGKMTLLNRNAVKPKKQPTKEGEQPEAPVPHSKEPVWQVIEGDHWFN